MQPFSQQDMYLNGGLPHAWPQALQRPTNREDGATVPRS